VSGDDPMTPRTQIAKTPNSFVSSRVLGDVLTGPGSLKLIDPVDEREGFVASTDLSGSSMKLMDPVDERQGFVARVDDSGNYLRLMDLEEDGTPLAEIAVNLSLTSFKLIDPVDKREGLVALSDASGNSMKLMDRQVDGVPLAEMAVNLSESSFRLIDPVDKREGFVARADATGNSMKLMYRGADGVPLIEMNGGIGGEASMVMFNPQPEPPAVLMQMNTIPSDGASLVMFNPQPEPPAEALLEMNTTQYGANLAMAAPSAGGLRTQIDHPVMEISTGLGNVGSIYMFNPQPEPPAILTSIVSSMEGPSLSMYEPSYDGQGDLMFDVYVSAQGASISLSDEIGKYMGLDPSPFVDGGFIYMYDPASEDSVVSLGSNGHIWAHNGNFGSNTSTGANSMAVGTNNVAGGDNSFAGGQLAQANHDNCFVWSDYPLGPSIQPTQTSADNEFLVRATGGVAFYSNASFTSGVALGPGASSWSAIVPPGPDLNMRAVDGEQILARIGQLPLKYYSQKDRHDGIEHIGPLAKDFNELFGNQGEDTYISMSDESGVALAGVQALLEKIERLEARIAELEAERR